MTLTVLDENGKEVTGDNPIITEHNGSTGDVVVLPLTLINKSHDHYHKHIQLQVTSVHPVTSRILVKNDLTKEYYPVQTIIKFEPDEKLPFNLRLSVNKNTPEQVVRGMKLSIKSMKYPTP